MYIQAEQN